MKIWLSLIFCMLLFHCMLGQSKEVFVIRGQVVEKESKKTLSYTTVALVQLPFIETIVKGVVTDGDGCFVLVAPKNDYLLIVRNLGFCNFTKPLSVKMEEQIDLGIIELQIQPEQLDMVTVKPLVEIAADEITYNLMVDPDRETATLHEILDKVPMIERNSMGNLYVENPDKKFLVVRNGRVDALFDGNINDMLKAIPAKGFATVTVMLAPPERYGEYDYVVDITTDKNARLYGAIGRIEGKGDLARGSVAPDAGVTTSLKKVRVNLGSEYETRNIPQTTNSIHQEQVEDGSFFKQEEKINSSGEKWAVGGMVSQDLSQYHFMNWRFSYGEEYSRSKSYLENYVNDLRAEITDFVKRESIERWFGAFEYQYDIGTSKQVLNVAYQFNMLPKEKKDSGNGSDWITVEKDQEQTVQLHYYNPLKKGFRLEAGVSYIYRNYFQEIKKGDDVNDALEDRKHIVNVYGGLSYSRRQFSASVKVKADYLNDGDGVLVTTDSRQERISVTGTHFSPEARISLVFPKKEFSRLSLNYKLWHYRPPLRMLSVYEDLSNPDFIKKGNSKLKEVNEHVLSLQASISNWYTILNWIHSGNRIGSYWYQDEQQRVIQTYANLNSYSKYSLSINRSFRYKQWSFSIQSGTGYTHSRMAQDEKGENWNLFLFTDISHDFKKGLMMGMCASYIDHFSSGYSSNQIPPCSLSVWFRKQFMNERGELEIRYADLLRFKYDTEQQVDTDIFRMTQNSHHTYIPLSISLKLRIGSYKVKPTRQIRRRAVIDDIATE